MPAGSEETTAGCTITVAAAGAVVVPVAIGACIYVTKRARL